MSATSTRRRLASHGLLLAALALHVGLVLWRLPPDVLAGSDPVLDKDCALHYANALEMLERLEISGRLWGYEPRYLAGYPGGVFLEIFNRPFVLAVGLGRWLGAGRAFNLMVALCLLAQPLLVALGARWMAAPGARWSFVAAAAVEHLDLLPRNMSGSGLLVFLVGSGLVVAVAGAALRFAHVPSLGRWLLLAAGLTLLVLVHPLAATAALAPLAVAAVWGWGRRMALGLVVAAVVVIQANLFWVTPLVAFWELKQPYALYLQTSGRRALLDYGWYADMGPRALVVLAGLLGLVFVARKRPELAACVAAGVAVNGLAGYFGSRLGPLAQIEPARFLVPMMYFAATLAPYGLARALAGLGRGRPWWERLPAPLLGAVVLVPLLLNPDYRFVAPGAPGDRFHAEFSDAERAIIIWVDGLRGWGRLLIDDAPLPDPGSSWDHVRPQMPHLTGRDVMAAHTSTLPLPHAETLLVDGVLAGRAMGAWSDEELEAWFERYGIRWVLATSEATEERLSRLPSAWLLARPGGVAVFQTRGGRAFLQGEGRLSAGPGRLDVAFTGPGKVVLKYRCMKTLRVDSSEVRLGCEPVEGDAVGFLSLEVDVEGPVAVTVFNGGLPAP